MKRRILLVDDDVAVLLTLKAVLELNNFEVHTADSASKALEKLTSGTYQMVITDVRMESDEAGLTVIREAKRQAYDPAIAILTAYPPQNGNWSQEGVESMLVKPVGTQDLLRQIEALLVTHEDHKQQHESQPSGRHVSPPNQARRRVS
jgi:DNA-binding NtrC family response regulator